VFLCAQNVDDVHEKAGSARVHHMHGELMKSRCESCFADAVRGPLCARHDPALRLRRARPPSYRLVR
jgi:NAD-dependent SIR2 family protein deacetylase